MAGTKFILLTTLRTLFKYLGFKLSLKYSMSYKLYQIFWILIYPQMFIPQVSMHNTIINSTRQIKKRFFFADHLFNSR